jgi:hypothetical protein
MKLSLVRVLLRAASHYKSDGDPLTIDDKKNSRIPKDKPFGSKTTRITSTFCGVLASFDLSSIGDMKRHKMDIKGNGDDRPNII